MRINLIVASALTSVIVLVGYAHAPVVPAIVGASAACAFALWRASGS